MKTYANIDLVGAKPSQPGHLVPKSFMEEYVIAMLSGRIEAPVFTAGTLDDYAYDSTALTLSSSDNLATVFGAVPAVGARLLVLGTVSEDFTVSGIYTLTDDTAGAIVFTRADDYNKSEFIHDGDFVYVQQGAFGGKTFRQTAHDPITLDATPLEFVPFVAEQSRFYDGILTSTAHTVANWDNTADTQLTTAAQIADWKTLLGVTESVLLENLSLETFISSGTGIITLNSVLSDASVVGDGGSAPIIEIAGDPDADAVSGVKLEVRAVWRVKAGS